jgi:hypothetical protein
MAPPAGVKPIPSAAASTDGPAGRNAKKPRSSHNEIEKRYRENINERMRELRDVVPALAAMASAEMDAMDEDGDNAGEGAKGAGGSKKLHKAAILKGAADHILHLTMENDQLRAELEGLKAILTGTGPLPLSVWDAAPVMKHEGHPVVPAGTVAPLTLMILAGAFFFGNGALSDLASISPDVMPTTQVGHVDYGVVLGRANATAILSPAVVGQGSPLDWIFTLLRVLLACYCLLHIFLSVFVFPKKDGSRANPSTAKQAAQIVADSAVLAASAVFPKSRIPTDKPDTYAASIESSIAFPNGSVFLAKHAHLKALRVAEQPAAEASVRIMLTAAIHAVLTGDDREAAQMFELASRTARLLASYETKANLGDLSWMIRDEVTAAEFWESRAWKPAFVRGRRSSAGSAAAQTVAIVGNAFRNWMAVRVLSQMAKKLLEGGHQDTAKFTSLVTICRNLTMDAAAVGDVESRQWLDLIRLATAVWSDAPGFAIADAVSNAMSNGRNKSICQFAANVCVAVQASRRGSKQILERATASATDALAECNKQLRQKAVGHHAEDALTSMDCLIEMVFAISLALCQTATAETHPSRLLGQHLLRMMAFAPSGIAKDARDLLFPFVERVLN